MLVVTAPGTARHDPPYELDKGEVVSPVWERAARYDAVLGAIEQAGLPTVAPRRHHHPFAGVHDPDLVAWLRTGWDAWRAAGGPEVLIPDTFAHRGQPMARRPTSAIGVAGWWVGDTATPITAGSWEAAVAAADAALTAVDLVATGEAAAAHALTRPPGHHAGRSLIGGFCLVNHAAIAATALRAALGRVAVVDIDHHHGNGTQEIFWRDPDVLYTSLHAAPAVSYPWFTGHAEETGEGPGAGTTRNLPLGPGTDDDAYLATLELALDAVAAHDPAAVVLSLGTDTAASDPVGGLGLSPDAYPRIGAAIAALALPTVSVQEGGYDLDRVGPDTLAVLTALGGARMSGHG